MRVRFFTQADEPWRVDPEDREDETTDEYKAANGEYGLTVVPIAGDLVSFNEGDIERRVKRRVLNINPTTGDVDVLVELTT